MSRYTSYTKEFKQSLVKRILSGKDTAYTIQDCYGINHGTIYRWINEYKTLGKNAFEKLKTNSSYTKEFKLAAVTDYFENALSVFEIQRKYKIRSKSVVHSWILYYTKGKELREYDPAFGAYSMKSRKTTFEERLEIVKYVISNDNDYKGAAVKFVVPYASVYNWVKKFNDKGEEGLKEHRGRPSKPVVPERELTLEEKQAMEIEKLRAELEYKDLVISVLKKNNEITEKLMKNSRK